jgi:hypothetical protein
MNKFFIGTMIGLFAVGLDVIGGNSLTPMRPTRREIKTLVYLSRPEESAEEKQQKIEERDAWLIAFLKSSSVSYQGTHRKKFDKLNRNPNRKKHM